MMAVLKKVGIAGLTLSLVSLLAACSNVKDSTEYQVLKSEVDELDLRGFVPEDFNPDDDLYEVAIVKDEVVFTLLKDPFKGVSYVYTMIDAQDDGTDLFKYDYRLVASPETHFRATNEFFELISKILVYYIHLAIEDKKDELV
jgi:hypothetical protein